MYFKQSNNFRANLGDLGTGEYDICFYVVGIDNYSQCYSVKITEPSPLEVHSVKNNENVTFHFRHFKFVITHNNNKTSVNGNMYDLSLEKGINIVKINTDLNWVGIMNLIFLLAMKFFYYTSATHNDVVFSFGGSDDRINLSIYDIVSSVREFSFDSVNNREYNYNLKILIKESTFSSLALKQLIKQLKY